MGINSLMLGAGLHIGLQPIVELEHAVVRADGQCLRRAAAPVDRQLCFECRGGVRELVQQIAVHPAVRQPTAFAVGSRFEAFRGVFERAVA